MAFAASKGQLLIAAGAIIVGVVAVAWAQYSYPYAYNGNANCLSYFPPQCQQSFPPTATNVLGNTPISAIPTLLNALSSFTTFPQLGNTLQQNPPLYAGYNQLQNSLLTAYPNLLPANQALLQNLINSVGQAIGNTINGIAGLPPAAIANMNQYMPGVVPLLTNPGLGALSQQLAQPQIFQPLQNAQQPSLLPSGLLGSPLVQQPQQPLLGAVPTGGLNIPGLLNSALQPLTQQPQQPLPGEAPTGGLNIPGLLSSVVQPLTAQLPQLTQPVSEDQSISEGEGEITEEEPIEGPAEEMENDAETAPAMGEEPPEQ